MASFNSGRWLIDRRSVLRGIGSSIALPLLDCMVPLGAQAPVPRHPKRCIFLYVPNGVNTLTWQIEQAGSDYELSRSLEPLAPLREHITPISGLHHPNGLGKAHECEKIWLTGAPLPKAGAPMRNTVSVDQLMAEVVGTHTRFPSLELTVTGGSLAWSRAGVPLPAERKVNAAFQRLFGVHPDGVDYNRRRLQRRASVLDLVLEDAHRFRALVGNQDRGKLDDYLDAVRDVEQRTQRSEGWLDTPRPTVDSMTTARLSRSISDAQAGEYYRTVYDLMVLALRTDMTRVITCMTGSEAHGLALPEIDIQQTRHELSHHNSKPEVLHRLTRADTFLTRQFAYFLDQLRSFDEEGESLLDHSLVLYGSGMSYGHSHGNANLPTILAGGRAFGLRHGRHIDFNLPKVGRYDLQTARGHYELCLQPVDPDARLSNLLLSLLQLMGVKADAFADSQAPLSEILA